MAGQQFGQNSSGETSADTSQPQNVLAAPNFHSVAYQSVGNRHRNSSAPVAGTPDTPNAGHRPVQVDQNLNFMQPQQVPIGNRAGAAGQQVDLNKLFNDEAPAPGAAAQAPAPEATHPTNAPAASSNTAPEATAASSYTTDTFPTSRHQDRTHHSFRPVAYGLYGYEMLSRPKKRSEPIELPNVKDAIGPTPTEYTQFQDAKRGLITKISTERDRLKTTILGRHGAARIEDIPPADLLSRSQTEYADYGRLREAAERLSTGAHHELTSIDESTLTREVAESPEFITFAAQQKEIQRVTTLYPKFENAKSGLITRIESERTVLGNSILAKHPATGATRIEDIPEADLIRRTPSEYADYLRLQRSADYLQTMRGPHHELISINKSTLTKGVAESPEFAEFALRQKEIQEVYNTQKDEFNKFRGAAYKNERWQKFGGLTAAYAINWGMDSAFHLHQKPGLGGWTEFFDYTSPLLIVLEPRIFKENHLANNLFSSGMVVGLHGLGRYLDRKQNEDVAELPDPKEWRFNRSWP